MIELAKQNPQRFAEAVDELLAGGDSVLALRVCDLALRAHPHDSALALRAHPHDAALERRRAHALARLQARYEQINPFRFLVYSQWSGVPVPAVETK